MNNLATKIKIEWNDTIIPLFEYIEKILYEWKRKNIKTKEDVIKDKERYRKKKGEDVDVFDYNWLDE